MNLRPWDTERRGRAAWALLGAAMLAAAALLLWEGRSLTMFVDEWFFGYLSRQHFDFSTLLEPDNGHLALLPILITRISLELFGAGTALPLRLVAVATHLSIALMMFVILRRRLGPLWSLPPVVLFLFLGAAGDVLVGSHAMPIELAVATGLGAWLALRARRPGRDVAAALLLLAGIASNGFALPFLAGAAVIIWQEPGSTWRRQWVVALPLLLYAVWHFTAGSDAQTEFSIWNVGGLPAFAFDSLAAELASVTGLFTEPGGTQNAFQLGPGQALAGAALVGIGVGAVAFSYRPPRRSLAALAGLIVLWIATGMVAGPARQPDVARYIYSGVALLILVAGAAIAAAPASRRLPLLLAMTGVCALGLLPNLKAIRDAGTFFREQSNQDKAVLAAADLLPADAPGETLLEAPGELQSGGVADLPFTLDSYREARARFGTPADSLSQLEGAGAPSREGADLLLARGLPIEVVPASARPARLPSSVTVSGDGGRLVERRGCLEFRPLVPDSQLTVPLPPGGVWLRPAAGPPVSIGLRRFADGFAVHREAVGGRPSEVRLPDASAARGWQAQILPHQPLLVCGRARSS